MTILKRGRPKKSVAKSTPKKSVVPKPKLTSHEQLKAEASRCHHECHSIKLKHEWSKLDVVDCSKCWSNHSDDLSWESHVKGGLPLVNYGGLYELNLRERKQPKSE